MAADTEAFLQRVPVAEHGEKFRVLVLGPLTVQAGGHAVHVAGSHRRRLLALLASRAGRMASLDAIIEALWGEAPPPSAVKTVQSHVVRLRRSLAGLGDAVIETVPGGYRLALESEAIDVGGVERLIAQGREGWRVGDLAAAGDRFAAALELWRGPAYVEFRDAGFAAAEGVRLDELHLATREDLAEVQLAARTAASAIPALERLVRDEPGRERAWALLMRALYTSGRQHDALHAFQRARQALGDSYGLEPGLELRTVERQILDQDPSLAPSTSRSALATALRSSRAFVGRAAERAVLVTAWTMARAGSGQLRIMCGPLDSGRTRLAADLAGRALDDGGDVEYLRATDGLDSLVTMTGNDAAITTGVIVDAVAERCRQTPLVLIVDDAEWAPATVLSTIAALVDAVDDLALLLVVIADQSGGGPAVAATRRLDPDGALTMQLGPMPDADLAAIITSDGVDDDALPAVLSVANGLPGVARREAAAWAERTASSRLRAAAASSVGALAMADQAQVSVLDEVLELVAARARRDEMRSAKWTGRQPYRALASYGPQDAELFVGRERLVAELAARVLERRLVVVVGASGSGKSSLVRAGLVPLARSGRLPGDAPWQTHMMVPGHDPLDTVDAIDELDDPGPQLLVVDQFEEAFALPSMVNAFAARLLDLAGDPALEVHVVIVVRADDYGALASVTGLAEAAEHAQVLVGPPTGDEMRRIVDEPARRTGLTVEPALIDLVAADVVGQDAALPLVSAAMAEVWERRAGTELRADRYLEIGGIATAVERLGERALRRIGPAGHHDVRQVLLRLADVTDDGVWTRRRLAIDEIPDTLERAVDILVDARLVVRAEATIEIVHEVAFRAWPRLARWLEEVRADLVRERELAIAARTWHAEGRSDDDVFRGGRLQASIEWAGRHASQLPPQVGAFLDAGQRCADQEAGEARMRLAREIRARRRITRALLAASMLLVIALIAGVLAMRQADRADTAAATANREAQRADGERAAALSETARADSAAAQAAAEADRADSAADQAADEAARADAAALSADAERLGALAGLESGLDVSLLLSAQAYSMADTPSTRRALLRAVQRSPEAVRIVRSDGPRLLNLEVSPDGSTLVVGDNQGGQTLYEAETSRRIGRFQSPGQGGLAWTPDGTAFATVDFGADHDPSDPEGFRYDVIVVDAATLIERARFSGRTEEVSGLAFSTDGRWLVAAPSRNTRGHISVVTIWDVTEPGPPIRTIELPDSTDGDEVSFDATGNYVAVSVVDATVLLDVRTGERGRSFPGSGGVFSPDGRTLAVNSGAGSVGRLTLELVDVETEARRSLRGAHTAPIVHREFSADGTMLVTTGDDRVVRVWDTATGDELHTLSGHTGRVLGGALSPDGTTLYSTGLDRSIITWDLAGRDTIQRRMVTSAFPVLGSEQFAVVNDGFAVALQADTDVLAVADLRSGARSSIATGHGSAFALQPGEGNTVYTGGIDGVLRRWDLGTGAMLSQRVPSESELGIFPEATSADNTILFVQTAIGAALALDPDSLETIGGTELDIGREILAAAVSADGKRVAISTFDPPAVQIRDIATGDSRSVAFQRDVFTIAFSPDGSLLIAGDDEGQVHRIDPTTGTPIGEPAIEHDGPIRSLRFAPDGSQFTSGSTDGNIGIWDQATGQHIGTIQPGSPNIEVRSTWASDGHTVLAMYEDLSVYAFDTRPSAWFDRACRTANRQLSRSEWAELAPGRPYAPACG